MFVYSCAYYFPTVVKYGFRSYRNVTGKNLFSWHCNSYTDLLDWEFCSVCMLQNKTSNFHRIFFFFHLCLLFDQCMYYFILLLETYMHPMVANVLLVSITCQLTEWLVLGISQSPFITVSEYGKMKEEIQRMAWENVVSECFFNGK